MISVFRHYLWISGLIIVLMQGMVSVSWAKSKVKSPTKSLAPFTVTFLSGPSSGGNPTLFNMVPNSVQQLKFNITSNTGGTAYVLCSVSSSSMDSTTVLGGCTNPNSAATPAPVIITFTSGSTPGPVTHTLTVQDKSKRNTVQIPLTYTIVANATRTVTFENYCTDTVWFGTATGTLPPLSGSSCSTSANCPTGTECSGGQCFWIPPTPNTQSGQQTYQLNGFPGSGPVATNTITIPDNSATNTSPKQWSGGFAARTNCTFSGGGVITCETGDCGDDGTGLGGCALGQGFAAPVSQAEITMLAKKPDSYDITIINGFNLPIAIYPTTVRVGASSPYDCGAPGKPVDTNYTDVLYSTVTPAPTGTLGACAWQFTPPSNNLLYQWVNGTPGGACTTNADCGGLPNACGLTKANVAGNSATLSCGKLLGYWTQDEICAINQNFNSSSIVNCTSTSSITNCTANGTNCPLNVSGQYTFFNLLACTSSPPDGVDNALTFASCFATGAYSSVNCCGCSNWQSTAGFTGKVPTDPNLVPQCGTGVATTPNPNWTQNVLPNLTWLKNACPSAYTYPYDDKTSGFSCPYAYEQGQSAVNYTVTFCPDRKVIL